MMQKRCRKGEDDETNNHNNNSKRKVTVPSTSRAAELPLDILGEIKKKLCYRDHVRFSRVCKKWRAAPHEKRAGDVLPWCLLLHQQEFENSITYQLYEPLNLNQPLIAQSVDLDQFFDVSSIHMASPVVYLDGCLFFSLYDSDYHCTRFLLLSIPTNRATVLPRFHHSPSAPLESNFEVLKAVSTYPASPDCVFLALHVAHYHQWTIGIFRHGDTDWTTTEFNFVEPFGRPFVKDVVFIRGQFYFLCYDQQLASYDIASGELKINSFPFSTDYRGIRNKKFFALDGELMLMYYDSKVGKSTLTSYDWSHKLWVPLKNLGNRSLFISDCSVYVDSINYYGASTNKIYYQQHGACYVYCFENGELLESTSSGLRNWDGLDYGTSCSMWVEPPALLSK